MPREDLPSLKREIESHGLTMSIHCPLVKPEWYPEPPTWAFLCDVDKDRRELNLEMIRQTMEMAKVFGAEYVVVHFPSPPSEATDIGYAEAKRIVSSRVGVTSMASRVPWVWPARIASEKAYSPTDWYPAKAMPMRTKAK